MDMKMDQDKLFYAIVIALAAMLAAYLLLGSGDNRPKFLGGDKPFSLEATPGSEEEAAPAAAPSADATATTTNPKALTYESAVELYGGYRFQFVGCHGNPGSMTIKVGGKFLLDNRDAVSHKILVGKTAYTIAGHGFAVATASTVAGTYNITCDGGGAASLKVQK